MASAPGPGGAGPAGVSHPLGRGGRTLVALCHLHPGPARLLRYLRQAAADTTVGHNPLGALSVLALLLVLGLQVGTGLLSDDEIAFAGPLTRFVGGDTVAWATGWHKDWGQWLLLGLLALHLCAVAFYAVVRRKPGAGHAARQPACPAGTAASRDGLAARLLALLLIAACAAAAWWVYGLGSTPGF
jgi:hypothetical protein